MTRLGFETITYQNRRMMKKETKQQNSTDTQMGYDTLLAAVPERKDMDYEKVRAIGKEQYCIKGISCNLCDFMDREKGKINSCVREYVKRHCS